VINDGHKNFFLEKTHKSGWPFLIKSQRIKISVLSERKKRKERKGKELNKLGKKGNTEMYLG
jgi:hypothetical protein